MPAQNSETVHREHVDLLVIGWGKAGKTLAGLAARKGHQVAVIEQSADMVGGSCINVACIPTKILIHDAEQRRGSDDPDAYFAKAVSRRDSLTSAMRSKSHSLLDELDSVLLVSGRATFTGECEVRVTGGEERLQISADTVIVNTGSQPALPTMDGAQFGGRIHNSETLQHVSPLPRSLLVVGGGYVGLEFASMFAQYGAAVTILDRGERPLKKEDVDVAQTAVEVLRGEGVTIISGATVSAVADGEDHARATYTVDGKEHSVEAEAVLIALGRTPATVGLGLERAGVLVDDRGYVTVDEHLRTSAPGVYAVGDVNGGPQFTYISLDDYRIVADQLYGEGRRTTSDRGQVPYTVFLTPPLARVGLTEAAAREQGYDVSVRVKQMADIAGAPRAKIEGDSRGIVKIVVDKATDQVLGAALMHVHSQEVINLVSLAIRHRITASELRDSIYTHPSTTEALNEVLSTLQAEERTRP
jgi:pyruvate/2-oxoglutarate dehydrogenase complex dihydrolipoamide dehydrogenase (E3) component